jgi:hypothetical protein
MLKNIALLLGIALIGVGCGGGGSNNDDSSSSNANVTLRGSNLAQSSGSNAPALNPLTRRAAPSGSAPTYNPVDCKPFFILDSKEDSSQCGGNDPCYPNAGNRTGSCISPISVLGKASEIKLTGSSHGGGTRLLSTDESGGGNDDIYLQGEVFDLANPQSMKSTDNSEDHENYDSQHTGIAVNYDYIDVKFALPRKENDQNVTKFWTMRYALVSLPFTNDPVYECNELNNEITCTDKNETIAYCINKHVADKTEGLDVNETNVSATVDLKAKDYYGGLTNVKKGDILFCIKDSVDANCSASDWKWLDKTQDALVSSRPSSSDDVFSFRYLKEHKSTCTALQDSEGLDLDLGGWTLSQSLYNPIKFNSVYKDGGMKVYSFQDVNDSDQEGSKLEMYIDFDVENSILLYDQEKHNQGGFVDLSYNNLGTNFSVIRDMNDSQLARKIWFKPVFAYNFSGCDPTKPGECENIKNGMKANISMALSGATEPPVYECAEDQEVDGECVGDEDPYSRP